MNSQYMNIFLEKFVKEIIVARKNQIIEKTLLQKQEEQIEKNIKIEKLKQKLTPLNLKREFRHFTKKIPQIMPIQIPQEIMKPIQNIPQTLPSTPVPNQLTQPLPKKPFSMPRPTPQLFPRQMRQPFQGQITVGPKAPIPSELSFGKIDVLLKNPTITLIECPGPGKKIITKTKGQIDITNITLTENEIEKVIDEFSNKAKIPLVGGLLKAAIGNIIISAVVSKFVGSRFIINKQIPFTH